MQTPKRMQHKLLSPTPRFKRGSSSLSRPTRSSSTRSKDTKSL